jgi:hypothetical protein
MADAGVDDTATGYYNHLFNESRHAFSSRSVVVVTQIEVTTAAQT